MRLSRLRTAREILARDIEQASFEFAVAILRLVREYEANLPRSLADNLVLKGTGIGAAVAESQSTHRRRNALNKMLSARRACQETEYWLRLIAAADLIDQEKVAPYLDEVEALYSTLSTICAKLRQTLDSEGGK